MRLVHIMSIKYCREDDPGVTAVVTMEGTFENQRPKDILEKAQSETAQCVDVAVKRPGRRMEKGLQYKLEQLKLKRERLNSKLLRKSDMTNDMMHSFVNASAVREEMEQFNALDNLFTVASGKYQHLLTDDDLQLDIQWI